jgi:general secretion pathway protein D
MKRFFLVLLVAPLLANAENVSLSFHAVPVMDFAEATYHAMLGRDYLITPDLIGLDKRVSINVKAIDRSKLPGLLGDVLATVGVRARDVGGIVRLEKVPGADGSGPAPGFDLPHAVSPAPSVAASAAVSDKDVEAQDFEVYRPKNRTVEYLQMVLRAAGFQIGALGASGQGQQVAQDQMVFSGTEEKRAKVRKLLDQLDQKPAVMNVRAALVEFTDSKEDSFSFGAVIDVLGSRLQLALNADTLASGNYGRLKAGGIDAVLKAINGDSRFRFRTQPTLRLVDGERGRLMVGSEVPVRGQLTLSKDGTPIQSIEYKSSGLVLTIQPRALDGRFTASVVQEVSSFAATSTSGIDSPTLNKRQIEATVDAEDGEVVVLAGLDEESVSDGSSGLSWLPFKTSRTFTSRTTQIFVLLEIKRI